MTDVTFIRGNQLQFSTQFFNATGNPVTPDSAVVEIRTAPYDETTTPVETELNMTDSSGTWTATWDTTGIAPALVFWAIKSTNPGSVDEGYFNLTGNWANA